MTRPDAIVPVQDADLLDSQQLDRLEKNFLAWAAQSGKGPRQRARNRIVFIFLIIRYTGAKLSEALGLEPGRDLDMAGRSVSFKQQGHSARTVALPEKAVQLLERLLPHIHAGKERLFDVDPAFVRRKFYERAEACGFEKSLGGPEMIRKARALELMRNNMPLPVVQRLLGHATPKQTSALVSFSEEDMRSVARLYMEREDGGKSSARNSFYGKVSRIEQSGVQSLVELATPDGQPLVTLVTNASVERLGIRAGSVISAEVKAPWLMLERCDRPGASSADNCREGTVSRIRKDAINAECVVRLADETELCAIVSTEGFAKLDIREGDRARVLFSAYAVVLHAQ